jgi:hypothetical protein
VTALINVSPKITYLVLFTKYYYDNKIKEDVMGGARSSHGDMRNAKKLWFKGLEVRDHSEHLNPDRRIILKCLKHWVGGCVLD